MTKKCHSSFCPNLNFGRLRQVSSYGQPVAGVKFANRPPALGAQQAMIVGRSNCPATCQTDLKDRTNTYTPNLRCFCMNKSAILADGEHARRASCQITNGNTPTVCQHDQSVTCNAFPQVRELRSLVGAAPRLVG